MMGCRRHYTAHVTLMTSMQRLIIESMYENPFSTIENPPPPSNYYRRLDVYDDENEFSFSID